MLLLLLMLEFFCVCVSVPRSHWSSSGSCSIFHIVCFIVAGANCLGFLLPGCVPLFLRCKRLASLI